MLLALLVWWSITRGPIPESRLVSPATVPSPGEVLGSVRGLIQERGLGRSIAASMQRVLLGFGLAVLVGVPLGILAASFRALQSFLAPVSTFGRNIPLAALIPLSLVWFGIGEAQKVMFIFVACAPFVFFDALQAVLGVHNRYVETAQTLGASRRQIIFKVLVPLALPQIYHSLRLLFGLAFGYIMLAEMINADSGLGFLLNMSQRRAMTADLYFILIVICVLAIAIDRLFLFFYGGFFPYLRDRES